MESNTCRWLSLTTWIRNKNLVKSSIIAFSFSKIKSTLWSGYAFRTKAPKIFNLFPYLFRIASDTFEVICFYSYLHSLVSSSTNSKSSSKLSWLISDPYALSFSIKRKIIGSKDSFSQSSKIFSLQEAIFSFLCLDRVYFANWVRFWRIDYIFSWEFIIGGKFIKC